MVSLENYDDIAIKVKIYGDNFHKILELVKSMPVRNYYKHPDKIWTIPYGDLAILVTKLKKINITDIKVEKIVKERFFQFKKWKADQLDIKTIDDETGLIKEIKKEMVIDERMYPFQIIGAYFLYKAEDALLCDMVGLGKSVQALSAVESHMRDKSINFCIIICPSTLKKNWMDEVETWTGKQSVIITGSRPKRKKIYKQAYKFDYLIINYDLLHHDIDLIDEFILQKGYVYSLILDEIQYVKNNKAKRSKHSKNISAFAKYSLGLSATAIENSLMDLWSVFQAVNEDVFGGDGLYYHFKDKYLLLDWFGNPTGYKNEKIIKFRMAPYLIRRMKDQVLDELPDKIENNYWVQLSPIQKKFYNEVANQVVTNITDMEKAEKIKYAEILPMITYLRQCVLSSNLVGHEENISTKTDVLIDFIESLDDKSKIVIFCHFIGMIENLKKTLDSHGYKNIAIHGNSKSELYCPVDKRIEVIKKFNQDDSIKVLVTSDILTEGVNITSANYIVNFDILFNPAKMEQRIGRIDRIGNKHKVINIVNIIAENTIEQEVFEKVWMKRNMSLDILDNNQVENRLTIRDIKSLLEIKK